MRRTAIILVMLMAFLIRMAPVIRWDAVMGVDAYYHMRLSTAYVVCDTLYAGTRCAVYPPLFHALMHSTGIRVETLAIYAPPVISTATVAATYFTLREDRKLATVAAFLMAVHPALLMRCYFFPELLALLIMPFAYAAVRKSPRREAGAGALLVLTHSFTALYYFLTVLPWPSRRRRVYIPLAGIVVTAAFALAQGPSVAYGVRTQAYVPALYGFVLFLPFALLGWKGSGRYRGFFYAVAISAGLCVLGSKEVATHRFLALSALCICTTAALGLKRIARSSAPLLCIALVCLALISSQYVGVVAPIYRGDDTTGAEYLGTVSISPVASTAGHLTTYYGSAVLVDEYAQYGEGHDERTGAMLSVILGGSTDYRVLDSIGVRLLFAEASIAAPMLGNASCVYDGGASIFVMP